MAAGALGDFLRIKPHAIVAHGQQQITLVLDAHHHPAGAGVLAYIGQGFLQDEQHLQLLIRRQRRAVALALHFHPQAGLPAKALQNGVHCAEQILRRQAGAKIGQQLAHIVVAFLHAGLDLPQALGQRLAVVAAQRVFQHLGLQIQKRQTLGNAVMQALRHQIALFQHCQLARGGCQPLVVQRGGQVLAQGFQQLTLLAGKDARLAKMQVIHAQQARLRADGKRGHHHKAFALAVKAPIAGGEGFDARFAAGRRLAAHTFTQRQTMLALGQTGRQAMLGHQKQHAVRGVAQPHRAAVGGKRRADSLQKTLAEFFQRGGAIQKSSDFIQ